MAQKRFLSEYNHKWIKEWSDINTKTIEEVYYSKTDKTKYWWVCNKGQNHDYQTTMGSRASGSGCNICSGHVTLAGFNDISTTHPEIAQYYAHEHNDTPVESVSIGQRAMYNWVCPIEGHIFKAKARDFNDGFNKKYKGYVYCSGAQVLLGFNDLPSQCPEAANHWDYDKNDDSPYDWTCGGNTAKWWICKNGHSELKKIYHKTENSKCIECIKDEILNDELLGYENSCKVLKELEGKNITKFYTIKQRLIDRKPLYEYVENREHYRKMIMLNLEKGFEFICNNGHYFKRQIKKMIACSDCPKCLPKVRNYNNLGGTNTNKGKKINYPTNRKRYIKKENLIINKYPYLVKEYSSKNEMPVEKVTCGLSNKFLWNCSKCGYSWRAKVERRINRKTGEIVCHKCNKKHLFSQEEKELLDKIKKVYHKEKITDNDRTVLGDRLEIDIHIESLNVAIEYNGIYWHNEKIHPKTRVKHDKKEKRCKEKGLQLIVVWSDDYTKDPEYILQLIQESISTGKTHKILTYKNKRKLFEKTT